MGKMNLLTASFSGKVGQVYGEKQHRKHFLKAVPFSHAPTSKKQKNAVRAFECLNRMASWIAYVYFPYLNLDIRQMLKHNAVAKWLKPLVFNGIFNINALSEVIKSSGEFSVSGVTVNLMQRQVTFDITISESFQGRPLTDMIAFLVSETGYVMNGFKLDAKTQTVTIPWKLNNFTKLTLIVWGTTREKYRTIQHGLYIFSFGIPIVQDKTLYCEYLHLSADPVVINQTIYFAQDDTDVRGKTLYFA